jgi:acyl dehydratase
MSVSTSEFKTEAIGTWGDPDEFVVERDRIKAYAEAANDPFPVHQSGDIAPPVFAVVPAFGALAATSTSVIPPDALMMVLHGEQDFHFHQPIRPDTTLVTRAVTLGVHPRSSGVTVNVKGETRDKDTDELVVEQYMISFVRGQQVDEAAGEEPLPHGFDEGLKYMAIAEDSERRDRLHATEGGHRLTEYFLGPER